MSPWEEFVAFTYKTQMQTRENLMIEQAVITKTLQAFTVIYMSK